MEAKNFIYEQAAQIAHREAQARTRLFIDFIEQLYEHAIFKPCELDLTIDDANPTTQFRTLYDAIQDGVGQTLERLGIDIDEGFRRFQHEINVFSPVIAPYTKSYETIFASVIETSNLQGIDTQLADFVFERYWYPADALHIRYNWQILQERANQLKANEPEAQYTTLPRLNAAIDWLKDYEQQLVLTAVDSATTQQVSTTLRWSGETGESWVLTSRTHGKSPSDKTAAL